MNLALETGAIFRRSFRALPRLASNVLSPLAEKDGSRSCKLRSRLRSGPYRSIHSAGQTEIPAIVIEAEESDCLVMSLVENCARRQHRAPDLLQDIGTLRGRGYNDHEIAAKIGVSSDYIRMIGTLLKGRRAVGCRSRSRDSPNQHSHRDRQIERRGRPARTDASVHRKETARKKLVAVRRLLSSDGAAENRCMTADLTT